MYGSNFRAEDKKSSDWIQRLKSESGRKGAKILRDAGVTVVEDFMRDKCDELNPIFFIT